MIRRLIFSLCNPLSLLWLVTVIGVCGVNTARAYSPEDPEVRAMVDRGVKYLEGLSEIQMKSTPYGGGDAQVVLAAYAHFKAEHDPEAPLVKLGIKNALEYVKKMGASESGNGREAKSVYEVSVVIFFLAELDPVLYASQLKTLVDGLFKYQNSNGGFGYPSWETGDISQVQYVALAAWTLDRSGIDLPLDKVASMLAWTMRVQDVTGPWPYQAKDPGAGRGLVSQPKEEMSVTMCLAGGSCVLIAADIFRIWNRSIEGNDIEGLPKAIKQLQISTVADQRRKLSPVKQDGIINALRQMNGYRSSNPFKRTGEEDWYYYMLYTLERYESFIELATGNLSQPKWYDENVKALMGIQDTSGAWGVKDKSKLGPPVSTAFAILFLIRSTKKAIGTLSKGTLAGGYGLPKDTTDIVVNGTQISAQPAATAVTDLLNLLEADGADKLDGKSIPEDIKLEQDPARRKAQVGRLERLLRGSKSWQARRVAARMLGQSDELSVVPTLIFALSDPDRKVRAYALDGLNFISRKFGSGKSIAEATSEEIRQIQGQWVSWYKSIMPNYEFIEGF